MRPSSAKAKGRRFQQWVRDRMLDLADWLEPDDVRSTSMGASGEDLLLSPAARQVFPISMECKNQERLSIWKAMEQAAEHAASQEGSYVPVVFFTRNRTPEYACLPAEDLLQLYVVKACLRRWVGEAYEEAVRG